MVNEKNDDRKAWLAVGAICGAILFFIQLVPGFQSLLISFQSYMPMRGLVDSPFVGFANYFQFFQSPQMLGIIMNTMTMGILTGLITSLLAGLAIVGLAGMRNKPIVFILLGISFLPLLVTQYVLVYSAVGPSMNGLITPAFYKSVLTVPYIIAAGVLMDYLLQPSRARLISCIFIGALGAGFYAGVCGGLSPLSFFSVPANYVTTDTVLQYSYRVGFITAQYSISSVGHIVAGFIGKSVLAVLLAISGLLLVMGKKSYKTQGESRTISVAAALPAVGAALLTALPAIFNCVTAPSQQVGGISPSNYIASLLYILAPFPGVILGFGLSGLFTINNKIAKICLLVCSALILTDIGTASFADFLMVRRFGLLNTILPNFDFHYAPLFAGAAVGLLHKRDTGAGMGNGFHLPSALMLSGGIGLLLSAYSMGDPMVSLIYTARRDFFTIAALQREMALIGGSPYGFGNIFYIILLLVIVAGGLALLWGGMRHGLKTDAHSY